VLIRMKHLLKVLEVGSVDWMIDPIVVRFEEQGIVMTNVSEGYTMLAHVVIPVGSKHALVEGAEGTVTAPIIAGEYEPIGEVVFSEDIVKQLKKMFKGDDTVRLVADESNITIEGSTERFSFGRQILDKQMPSIEFTETEYGLILAKPKILGIYNIDITQLANLVYEDVMTFKFTQDGVTVSTNVAGGRYEVRLRTFAIKQAPPSTYIQVFDGEYIEALADVVDVETAWFVVTEEPLHILVKDPKYPYVATFVLAPRMG
jgi:predicted RNA-binding protein